MNKNVIVLSFIAIVFLAGCANPGQQPNAELKPNYSVPPFIIDSHIHYRASDAWEKAFVDTFAKYNAMGCVLVDMKYLDRGIAFAKAHPDRVIPYAAVNIDSSTVLKDIQKAYDMGYKGLGNYLQPVTWITMIRIMNRSGRLLKNLVCLLRHIQVIWLRAYGSSSSGSSCRYCSQTS